MSDPEDHDGWIRTPLPPTPRGDEPMFTWFARISEPLPPVETVERVPMPLYQRTATAVLFAAVLYGVATAMWSLWIVW